MSHKNTDVCPWGLIRWLRKWLCFNNVGWKWLCLDYFHTTLKSMEVLLSQYIIETENSRITWDLKQWPKPSNGTDRVGRGHATLCKQRVYSREDSGKCKRFRGQRHEAAGLAGESAGGRSRWGCAGKWLITSCLQREAWASIQMSV